MNLQSYYHILGVTSASSIEEIKKSYRKKARLYHPDINHDPGAKDKFITATEAYEFLISHYESIKSDESSFTEVFDNWEKSRKEESRKRAAAYSRASYYTFKRTKFYKTTRILDGTTIIFSFVMSILLLVYTVFGYIYRLKHPIKDLENPSVAAFIMFLILGMIFFVVSFIYLRAFQQTSQKRRKK